MTYTCPYCGKPCTSQADAAAHCSNTTCPECGGKGFKEHQFSAPEECQRCKGSGRVKGW